MIEQMINNNRKHRAILMLIDKETVDYYLIKTPDTLF